jgi:type III restriction enzyme
VDLSATPFYLSNSGYPEGSPFPWLVSDFGLVDAIECGITKVPRLPVADDSGNRDEAGRPDPKYFRLWRNIQSECGASEKVRGTPKADAVYKYSQDALLTLASQWKTQFEKVRDDAGGRHFIPPVMIVVCDNTEISQVMYEKIAGEVEVEVPDPDKPGKTKKIVQYGGGEVFPDLLGNSESIQNTIRIDSKLVDQDDVIRDIVGSVGVRGGLGEQIRCVVSVSMLTEGWDANNVTHILGIRAFGSQLLCEQVVGRGLRRMSYTPDPETGLLPAEYADVYGIPFSLIPFKGKPKESSAADPIYHAIYPLEQRAHYEIRMPNVEGYVYELRDQGIRCDVDALEPMIIDRTPAEVWLEPTRGYRDDSEGLPAADGLVKHTREAYYETVRPQQVIFMLAQRVLDQLLEGASAEDDRKRAELRLRARHQLFPELVTIVQRYVNSKVQFREGLDIRELGLQVYAQELVTRLCDNILPSAAEKGKLIPLLNRFRPYNSTADVNYQTTRPVEDLTRSHLNRAMIQSELEREAIDVLEDLDCVECYTPNDTRVGLVVPYEYNQEPKSYEPDFVVKLQGGKMLMLEIKGGKGKIHDENRVFAKNAAAKKWCTAVSNLGRYGDWGFEIWDDTKESVTDLRNKIAKHGSFSEKRPFRVVSGSEVHPWENCVPLVTLRSLVTKEDQQAKLADGAWDHELITWDDHPAFEPGMFVARVDGTSMDPLIPAGTYCLFRKAGDTDLAERVLLVSHPKINDAEYGGNWTIRKVSVTGSVGEGPGAEHGQAKLTTAMPGDLPVVIDLSGAESLSVLGEFVGTLPTEASFEREAEV